MKLKCNKCGSEVEIEVDVGKIAATLKPALSLSPFAREKLAELVAKTLPTILSGKTE